MTVEQAHDAAIRRCRRVIRWLDDHRGAELLPIILCIALVVIAWRGESQTNRSDERDAARAYQRCLQQRPTILVVSTALDTYPELRRTVREEHPEALDADGRLPVPDCARIYPRGAEVSHRYPDLTPTRSGR